MTHRTDSFSIGTMIEFGDGTYKNGVPQLWSGIVDVRDVAGIAPVSLIAHDKVLITVGALKKLEEALA